MADRLKDDYFEAKFDSDLAERIAKAELKGKLSMLDDLIGLPAFVKAFEVPSSK